MAKLEDENDLKKAGRLNADPMADAVPARLRVVKAGEAPPVGVPVAMNAERALLAALLWSGTNCPDTLRVSAVADILDDATAFYESSHKSIFAAIRACAAAKQEHDPVAVHGQIIAAGDRNVDMEALLDLKAQASTVSERQARTYAEAIRDAWARRKVIEEATAVIDAAKSGKTPAVDLVTQVQTLAANTAERTAQRASFVWVKDSAIQLFDALANGQNTAMPTGLRDLDEALSGGLRPKEVSVLAARTNVGKSAVAAQIAEHMVTADDSLGVLYVTLEMVHTMFTARLVAARSGVALSQFRKMTLTPTEWTAVTTSTSELANKRLAFADNPTQTMAATFATAKACATELHRTGKRLALVVIDHLGLVKPSADALKRMNREQQVAETSRAQRYIAAELGCHVMGIAQIGREADKMGAKGMPKLHNLRESGSLEMDADLVFILHRERDASSGMFNNAKPPAFAIAKGRMDETKVMLFGYDPGRCRFTDWNSGETYSDFYGG